MISGRGVGTIGSEPKDEPREDSRARYNSALSADSTAGIGTATGRVGSPILGIEEKGFGIRVLGVLRLNLVNLRSGFMRVFVTENGFMRLMQYLEIIIWVFVFIKRVLLSGN